MRVKTVQATSVEEFDKLVSETSEMLKGKFTQTHVSYHQASSLMIYTAVIFYE